MSVSEHRLRKIVFSYYKLLCFDFKILQKIGRNEIRRFFREILQKKIFYCYKNRKSYIIHVILS